MRSASASSAFRSATASRPNGFSRMRAAPSLANQLPRSGNHSIDQQGGKDVRVLAEDGRSVTVLDDPVACLRRVRQQQAVPTGEQPRGRCDIGSRSRGGLQVEENATAVIAELEDLLAQGCHGVAPCSDTSPTPSDVGHEVVDGGGAEGGQVAAGHVSAGVGDVDLGLLDSQPLGSHRIARAAVSLAVIRDVDHRYESGEVAPVDARHRAVDRPHLGGHESIELERAAGFVRQGGQGRLMGGHHATAQ